MDTRAIAVHSDAAYAGLNGVGCTWQVRGQTYQKLLTYKGLPLSRTDTSKCLFPLLHHRSAASKGSCPIVPAFAAKGFDPAIDRWILSALMQVTKYNTLTLTRSTSRWSAACGPASCQSDWPSWFNSHQRATSAFYHVTICLQPAMDITAAARLMPDQHCQSEQHCLLYASWYAMFVLSAIPLQQLMMLHTQH